MEGVNRPASITRRVCVCGLARDMSGDVRWRGSATASAVSIPRQAVGASHALGGRRVEAGRLARVRDGLLAQLVDHLMWAEGRRGTGHMFGVPVASWEHTACGRLLASGRRTSHWLWMAATCSAVSPFQSLPQAFAPACTQRMHPLLDMMRLSSRRGRAGRASHPDITLCRHLWAPARRTHREQVADGSGAPGPGRQDERRGAAVAPQVHKVLDQLAARARQRQHSPAEVRVRVYVCMRHLASTDVATAGST